MTKIGPTQSLRKPKLALLLALSFLPRILSAQSDSVINWGDPPSIGYVIRSEDPPAYSIALPTLTSPVFSIEVVDAKTLALLGF